MIGDNIIENYISYYEEEIQIWYIDKNILIPMSTIDNYVHTLVDKLGKHNIDPQDDDPTYDELFERCKDALIDRLASGQNLEDDVDRFLRKFVDMD